jgi:hypothetical protein
MQHLEDLLRIGVVRHVEAQVELVTPAVLGLELLNGAEAEESAVDHHRTRFRQGGSENFEAFVEEHRDMCWGVHVIPVSSDVPIPVRYLPWGKYFRGGRESQHR